MENLLFLGLATAFLFTAAGSMLSNRVQPPQIIVMQVPLTDQTSSTGCLPLIILVAIILAAITVR